MGEQLGMFREERGLHDDARSTMSRADKKRAAQPPRGSETKPPAPKVESAATFTNLVPDEEAQPRYARPAAPRRKRNTPDWPQNYIVKPSTPPGK